LLTQQGIANYIEKLWAGTSTAPELIEAMRLTLSVGKNTTSDTKSLSSWTDLPGLSCQAAGGHPEWADDLTVAWLLFYSAAHLMDKVQDQDMPDPWWEEMGTGAALSAATGLYSSGSLALCALYHHPDRSRIAPEITKNFYDCLLMMASGQYNELTVSILSLEKYWEFASAKSGVFFALAAREGARLATDDGAQLANFDRFGYHLGLLTQIRDDLDDVCPPSATFTYGQRREMSRSLPVVYALSVLPAQDCEYLRQCLKAAPTDARAAKDVINLLNQSNTTLYLAAELERHCQLAQEAIRQAAPPSPARDALESLIWKL
jgi:geranylgeranyl pyrophosphate synthase